MVIIHIARLLREDVEVPPHNSVLPGLSEGAVQVICLAERKRREKGRGRGFVLWIRGVRALPNLLPICYVPQK